MDIYVLATFLKHYQTLKHYNSMFKFFKPTEKW